jgi:hypothetical protein
MANEYNDTNTSTALTAAGTEATLEAVRRLFGVAPELHRQCVEQMAGVPDLLLASLYIAVDEIAIVGAQGEEDVQEDAGSSVVCMLEVTWGEEEEGDDNASGAGSIFTELSKMTVDKAGPPPGAAGDVVADTADADAAATRPVRPGKQPSTSHLPAAAFVGSSSGVAETLPQAPKVGSTTFPDRLVFC